MTSDKDFSPMLYDVMRELATRLGGRYVEWMDESASGAAENRWRAEHARVTREARAIDPDDQHAIEAHTAKLRAELVAMPRHAPVLRE